MAHVCAATARRDTSSLRLELQGKHPIASIRLPKPTCSMHVAQILAEQRADQSNASLWQAVCLMTFRDWVRVA
jgi:hypothetical protein